MPRPILLGASLILGLAGLTVFTSLSGDDPTHAAALRSLRSGPGPAAGQTGAKREIWRPEEDVGEDLLAREEARWEVKEAPAGRGGASKAKGEAPPPSRLTNEAQQPATTKRNDARDDRNDRPGNQNAGPAQPQLLVFAITDQGIKTLARRNSNDDDEEESDRTTAHLLAREEARTAPLVPKTLHFILPGIEPPHLRPVVDYSRRRAARQGWDAKIWKGVDVDELVKTGYPQLRNVWAGIKKTSDAEERRRKMGSFMKLVVLHSEGGVYLDADLVPCAGLDDLLGSALHPIGNVLLLPYGLEGMRRAFAAAPGHPVLTKALKSVEVMGMDDGSRRTAAADPARALMRAVASAMSVPVSTPPDATPKKGEDGWTTISSVRLGSLPLIGGKPSPSSQSQSELDLWHLDLHLYGRGGGREFLSKCSKDTEDIAPFLEEGCRAENRGAVGGRGKFEDCGRSVA